MSERNAEIIPFPARPGRQSPCADGPPDRLAMALTKLDLALLEQQTAIENWRAALDTLKQSAGSLASGLGRYQEALGTLGNRVGGLAGVAPEFGLSRLSPP